MPPLRLLIPLLLVPLLLALIIFSCFRHLSLSAATHRHYAQLAFARGSARFVFKSRPASARVITAARPEGTPSRNFLIDAKSPPALRNEFFPQTTHNWPKGLHLETDIQEEWSPLWNHQLEGFAGERIDADFHIPFLLRAGSGATYDSSEGPGYVNFYTTPYHFAQLPLALPVILLLIPLARALHRKLKSTRNPTLCPTCRYDLRAHAPNQRCPECGTPIPHTFPTPTQ